VHPDDPEKVYAGTWGGGSYRTANGGRDWEKLDEHHTFSPTCIQTAPSDPDIIYACDRTAPLVHRSDDGGTTWRTYFDAEKELGEGFFMTSSLAVDPRNPDVVTISVFRRPVAMGGSLVRIDGKGGIEDLGRDLPRSVLEIEIDDRDPETLYVSTHVHGLYRSTDSGRTWQGLDGTAPVLPRTGCYDVDVHPEDSDILFASSLSGPLPDYMAAGETVESHLDEGGRIRNIDDSAESGV